MDIRPAKAQDTNRIRQIAERSFQTSYSLGPEQIETIVDETCSDEALTARIEADPTRIFVVTDDHELVGFADVAFDDHAFLQWLHVDPERRGEGAGTELFERVQTAAEDRDLPVVGRVLTEDEEGESFCEQFGFEQGEQTKIEMEDETFFGHSYVKPNTVFSPAEPVEVPETITADEKILLVDEAESTPGTKGPFFKTYEERSGDSYGYYCSKCGSADVGSDTLGRLECQNCGNKHLADEWDAAYF